MKSNDKRSETIFSNSSSSSSSSSSIVAVLGWSNTGSGIWTLSATSWAHHHVHETSVVLETTLGTAGDLLLLVLADLHLGRLSLHFAGTSQRAVHFASEQADLKIDSGLTAQTVGAQSGLVVAQRGAVEVQADLLLMVLRHVELLGDLGFELRDGELLVALDRLDFVSTN